MSVLILASVSTFLVILFATTAYVVNNGTFSKMRTDYDSKMQGIVSQMNNTEFKNYEKDRQNNAVLNRNLKNINTLQEADLEMQTDLDNFKKTYSDNTNKFRTDLTATTSNLNYLTTVVNNIPTAEQTQDILGLQDTTQDHETRIQGNESALTANGASITSLNTKTLAHSNAIISLSNQIRTNTAELNNLTSQNQININKIYLQGLSNQTISQNLSNLGGNFTTYSRNSTNWMAYTHSNLYSNVMPTLDTINQNYVAKANYNAHSNSVSQNLLNINNTLNDVPFKYAKSGDFNSLKDRTKNVEDLTNTLRGQYDGIETTYATKADMLKIKLTAADNSNADQMLSRNLSEISTKLGSMQTVDASLSSGIAGNSAEISTLKSQYTGLDSAYKTIITKDNAGANTFKLNANDTTNSKTAFQIVNGQAVLLDIKANGTTTLNSLNLNTTGTTNLSGTTTINNQVPATQPWVQSLINNGINTPGNINTPGVGRAKDNGDWFRINEANAGTGVSTALYNGLSINAGGGLDVGSWNKQPTGQIHANYIKSRGDVQVDGGLKGNNWVRSDTGFHIDNGSAWLRNDGAIEGNWLHSRGDAQVDSTLKVGSTFTADGGTLRNKERQHVYSDKDLYLLPKEGVIIGREWGGNGNLNAQGNISANGGIKGNDWVRSDTGFHVDNGSAWLRNDGVIKGNKIYTTDITRGRDDGDWLRINTDNMNTGVGTAIHNHVAINGGGGLDVGEWVKRPEGEIHANKIVSRGPVVLNDNKIQLRPNNDDNHVLGHRVSNAISGNDIDGPVLTGCGGGALGLGKNCGNKSILEWTGNGVQINGGLKICDGNGQNCTAFNTEEKRVRVNADTWNGDTVDLILPAGSFSKTFNYTEFEKDTDIIRRASTIFVPEGVFVTLVKNDGMTRRLDNGQHDFNWFWFNDAAVKMKITRTLS